MSALDYDRMYIALNPLFHNDVKKTEKAMAYWKSINWFMPSLPQNDYVRTLTHEFGHAIEYRIIQLEFKKLRLQPSLEWKHSKHEAVYNKIIRDVKEEILTKAQEIYKAKTGASCSKLQIEKDYLSRYGQTHPAEFFAECFANSRLGQSNILGDAISQWLKEKGYQN